LGRDAGNPFDFATFGDSLTSFVTLCRRHSQVVILSIAAFALILPASWAQVQQPLDEPGGPIRLRPVATSLTSSPLPGNVALTYPTSPKAPYIPGEFETFVQSVAGAPVKRLGAELVTEDADLRTADLSPLAPDDYSVAPGDELLVTIWGSVDADLRLVVDKSGRVSIPRVGPVLVAGVRQRDLAATIERRVAQVFRNFQVTATVGQLRGVRVFVTGFVQQPGTYSVSSLSTVLSALMKAGGPSAAGSFRQIELRRSGQLVATMDLYDLLLKGDRAADRVLQAGDVVHVGPVGPQVAVIGSVNKPAVVELKPGETVNDTLRMAGGFSAVADRGRLVIERLADRNASRANELQLPRDGKSPLSQGDVIRAYSSTSAALSTQQQNKSVRIEGEVRRPGDYLLPANSTLQDALQAAGGLTTSAYLFGTDFSRESVRIVQQDNYDRALRDLETDFTRNSATQKTGTAEQAAAITASTAANARLIERLKAVKPTGRIVLALMPDARELPPLVVESGDRLYIPPTPNTVGVFGSVYNGGSYLMRPGRTVDDVLRLAGGPTKGADADSIFVVRLDGSVVSTRQSRSGWFSTGKGLGDFAALPGDTIFVPEALNKTTFVQEAKEWTQILAQFGLGAAAIKTLRN
jgi:protein involved in polysaccharide export with SLBB domain